DGGEIKIAGGDGDDLAGAGGHKDPGGVGVKREVAARRGDGLLGLGAEVDEGIGVGFGADIVLDRDGLGGAGGGDGDGGGPVGGEGGGGVIGGIYHADVLRSLRGQGDNGGAVGLHCEVASLHLDGLGAVAGDVDVGGAGGEDDIAGGDGHGLGGLRGEADGGARGGRAGEAGADGQCLAGAGGREGDSGGNIGGERGGIENGQRLGSGGAKHHIATGGGVDIKQPGVHVDGLAAGGGDRYERVVGVDHEIAGGDAEELGGLGLKVDHGVGFGDGGEALAGGKRLGAANALEIDHGVVGSKGNGLGGGGGLAGAGAHGDLGGIVGLDVEETVGDGDCLGSK